MLKHDYTVRTQSGQIISPYAFVMHPFYGFHKINFATEPDRGNLNFKPLSTTIEIQKVELNASRLSFPFRCIIESGLIRIYQVSGLSTQEIYGTLKWSTLMESLGLQKNKVYLASYLTYGDYYTPYMFYFQ